MKTLVALFPTQEDTDNALKQVEETTSVEKEQFGIFAKEDVLNTYIVTTQALTFL